VSLAARDVQPSANPTSPAAPYGKRRVLAAPPQARRECRLEERLAILALAAALGAELALIWVGLDAQDEGYFLEQASRVLGGAVPYRDFDTLYTPAILYLHAALLSLAGGPHVIPLRAVGLFARVLLSGGLYVLCRPLVRPAFAVFPGLYVLIALDRVPLTWEPHPGWPSAAVTVLTVCAFARLPGMNARRRGRWLIACGAATALVFAFKQNAGAFLGLALMVFSAWQGVEGVSTKVTPQLRAAQIVLLSALICAVAWLIQPHVSLAIAAYFLVPIVAVGVAALSRGAVSSTGRPLRSWFKTLGFLGLGYLVLTVPWIMVLISALEGRVELLKGFVGAVDQDILWYPLQGPTGGAWASLVGGAVALAAATRARHTRALMLVAGGLALLFAMCGVLLTAQPGESAWRAVAEAPRRTALGLPIVLPVVSIVAGAWWSIRSPPTRATWRLRWMTVASALILLTEYPRLDEVHLAWSACLALATGAVVLGQAYAKLANRWTLHGVNRGVLLAALVAVPAVTALPNLAWRAHGLIDAAQVTPLAVLTSPPAVRGIIVADEQASGVVATAQYVRTMTAPGEPIFVYPSSPLLYVMTERPNPTRFAHLYPGAASADGLNGIIGALGQLPVRVVIVSEAALSFWGPPGANKPLEDYLARSYAEVARFGDYHVLIKSPDQPDPSSFRYERWPV
jgi:hypothetical protein